MKKITTPVFGISLFLFLVEATGSVAQCVPDIVDQGSNNAQAVTLVFNDGSGTPLETCNCNVAGSSGNLNCPKSCTYTVGYTTITYSDASGIVACMIIMEI